MNSYKAIMLLGFGAILGYLIMIWQADKMAVLIDETANWIAKTW